MDTDRESEPSLGRCVFFGVLLSHLWIFGLVIYNNYDLPSPGKYFYEDNPTLETALDISCVIVSSLAAIIGIPAWASVKYRRFSVAAKLLLGIPASALLLAILAALFLGNGLNVRVTY